MMVYRTGLATSFIFILFMRVTDAYTDIPCGSMKGIPLECVNINDCPILVQNLRLPLLPETKQMLQSYRCGFDNKMPKVCCPQNLHKNFYLLTQHKCGEYEENRIANGEVADLNEFPWMALLSYKVGRGRKFKCGGSLINDKYVLTAAHCINEKLLGVRIGEHNIRESKDCVIFIDREQCAENVQDFWIEKTIVHENFIRESYANDIALIRLEGTVILRSNAKPICLPMTPDTMKLNLTNLTMTVAGWGATENSNSSDVLRKVKVPVVSNADCRAVRRYMTSKKICAGGKLRKDACYGDSGGPLISLQLLGENLAYIQYGIVSFGEVNTCGADMHGVYTRVTAYVDWILDKLEP